jgi:RNA polymerase sigma factor (sigma-70 family)
MNNQNPMSADQLVELVVNGEAKGIAIFYTQYKSLIMKFFQKNFKIPRDDLEGLCDDILFEAAKKITSFDKKKSKLSSWLIMIAKKRLCDYFRKQKTIVMEITMPDDFWESLGTSIEPTAVCEQDDYQNEKRKKVEQAFEMLTEREKIILKYRNEGHENADIANWLGMEKGTVATAYNRAKKHFAQLMGYEMVSVNGEKPGDRHGTK